MSDKIKDAASDEIFAEDAKSEKQRKQDEYREIKAHAKKLETNNFRKLIAFPAEAKPRPGEERLDKNGEEKRVWYKLGNFSALCYVYELGPRMGKKNLRVRVDKDQHTTIMQYIVYINDLGALKANMKRLGYEVKKEYADGIVEFDLKTKYSKEDVKRWQRVEKEQQSRLNELILPKNVLPELGGQIVELTAVTLPRFKKMNKLYIDVAGMEVIRTPIEMEKLYHRYAGGLMTDEEFCSEMILLCFNAKSNILTLVEMRDGLSKEGAMDIGERLTLIQETVRRVCSKEKTTQTD